MVNSNNRRLVLCGWLMKNYRAAYESPLKLQKYLFFYEAFSKIAGKKADFTGLKGYERGPVFSAVWGDYTKDRDEFNAKAELATLGNAPDVDSEIAEKAAFLCSVLSEDELTEMTHRLNVWKKKEGRILGGEHNVRLSESDLDKSDASILRALLDMYPLELIRSLEIVSMNDAFFAIPKKRFKRLREWHMDALSKLSKSGELHNPVFVDIDESGVLVVE